MGEGKPTSENIAERIEWAQPYRALIGLDCRPRAILVTRNRTPGRVGVGRIGVKSQGTVNGAPGDGMITTEQRNGSACHPERVGIVLAFLDRLSCQTQPLYD